MAEQQPDAATAYVVATYEEIRLRFGLGGTDQARIKAKRRKWLAEPLNHPGAVARIRVPQKEWDAAEAEIDRARSRGIAPDHSLGIKALEDAATAFREERDRLVTERDLARDEASKAREAVSALSVRVAVAETEAKALRDRAEKAEVRADRAETDARRPFWRRWIG
jgi:hypothetical protein